MSKYGRRLLIPAIYEFHNSDLQQFTEYGAEKHNYNPQLKIKVCENIKGRPVVVLKKMVDFGFKRGYYDQSLIESLIIFGFDRGYWTDLRIFSAPYKYFLLDMGRLKSKEERLREIEENGI